MLWCPRGDVQSRTEKDWVQYDDPFARDTLPKKIKNKNKDRYIFCIKIHSDYVRKNIKHDIIKTSCFKSCFKINMLLYRHYSKTTVITKTQK